MEWSWHVIFLALLIVSGSLLSGCVKFSHDEIEAAFADADVRYHRHDDAAVSMSYDSFQVPQSTSLMEVRWAYRTRDSIRITIEDEKGSQNKTVLARHSGLGASSDEDAWTISDPPTGAWTVEARMHRDGSYAIGIYFH